MLNFGVVCFFFLTVHAASGIILNTTDAFSIRDAAALVAHGAQQLYTGNQTGGVPGKWPFPPYYWWESGGAWGSMMQYQMFTGDMSYHEVIYEALLSQLGPGYDYIMKAQVLDTGNDDQAFWVLNAMTAAEHAWPNPPSPGPPWLTVVEVAFEEFVGRWNLTYCNGGLKWQFTPTNKGFNYKQSISNGAFFQIAARLARYTDNSTYLDWAEKIWDWSRRIGIVDDFYHVFDGSDELINCTGIDHHQWSYNAGVYLYGAATLFNQSNGTSRMWAQHTTGLLNNILSTFLSPYANSTDILYEPECEPAYNCNTDQQSMKAYLARWLTSTSLVASFTANRISSIFHASAIGAAAACTGGHYGNTCGSRWYINGFDNFTGLGQQISALEVMTGLLVNETEGPGTQKQQQAAQWPNPFTTRGSTTVVIPSPSTTLASSSTTSQSVTTSSTPSTYSMGISTKPTSVITSWSFLPPRPSPTTSLSQSSHSAVGIEAGGLFGTGHSDHDVPYLSSLLAALIHIAI